MEFSKIKAIFLDESIATEEVNRMKLLSGTYKRSSFPNYLRGFGFVKLNNSHISEMFEEYNPRAYSVEPNKVDEFISFVSGKKVLMIESVSKNKSFFEYNKKFLFKHSLIIMSNGNKYLSISC